MSILRPEAKGNAALMETMHRLEGKLDAILTLLGALKNMPIQPPIIPGVYPQPSWPQQPTGPQWGEPQPPWLPTITCIQAMD